jgi:hypothetical protein
VIEIQVRQICFVMFLVSIPLLALAAASRSPVVIYAVAATTVIQMVAITLAGLSVAGRKRLTAERRLGPSR